MIRNAIYNDINRINELGSLLHENFVSAFHMETEINNEDAIVLVYEENDTVIGYLYALQTIDNIDLLSIIVDKSFRNKKIATKLVEYLINNYCYQTKTITLEVNTNNDVAINFYKKNGFKIVNTRKHYYNNEDAYLMKWGL